MQFRVAVAVGMVLAGAVGGSTAAADGDPLRDLAAKTREIELQRDLTTVQRATRFRALRPITARCKGTLADAVAGKVWLDVQTYRQVNGRTVPAGVERREVDAVRIDVSGDALALGEDCEPWVVRWVTLVANGGQVPEERRFATEGDARAFVQREQIEQYAAVKPKSVTVEHELVGKGERSFTVTADLERKTASAWFKGDAIEWSERVEVTDAGRLRASPTFSNLADLKRTPRPKPVEDAKKGNPPR